MLPKTILRRTRIALACLWMGFAAAQAGAENAPSPIAADQKALLASSDPTLAANKKLVYDMYREVLIAGRADRIPVYFGTTYRQHNPNVADGPEALAAFIRGSRPQRPIPATITLPLVSIAAERDLVVMTFVRPEKNADGSPYYTSWFDMFRIEGGRIVEHWDPALKSADALKFDPNSKQLPAKP